MKTEPCYRINVETVSEYLPEQSDEQENRYVFAYHITIRNMGSAAAQLLTRHWLITDGAGNQQEVRGPGVIGEQPWLQPGEAYQYTSGAVLETPVGVMQGSYQMKSEDGHQFDATILPFTLAVPLVLH